jgi:predicted O-methyltransferase YrrM
MARPSVVSTPKPRSKAAQLLRLLPRAPREFWERLLTFVEFQADRFSRKGTSVPVDFDLVIQQLGQHLGGRLEHFLREEPLREIEAWVAQARVEVLRRPAFDTSHNADLVLARLAYAICRLQQPEVVVETGVGYGVTSAFLLQALAVNNRGGLWSIDLPPLGEGADEQAGCLVPTDLRSRWHRLRGRTRRLLPSLVAPLPAIDIFLHDSLHTYRNMMLEYGTVWPKLRPGGVLLSDDVNLNRAFQDFVDGPHVAFAAVVREEENQGFLGAAIKGPA